MQDPNVKNRFRVVRKVTISLVVITCLVTIKYGRQVYEVLRSDSVLHANKIETG